LEHIDGATNISGIAWIDIDYIDNVVYVSLIGVCAFGLKAASITRFVVPYKYMFVNCKEYIRVSADESLPFFLNIPKLNTTPLGWLEYYGRVFNRGFFAGGYVLYSESNYFLVRINGSSGHSPNNVYYGSRD
jgi:hypothetical protein